MILLLTHSGDFYTIDGVEQHLQARGVDYRRLNTDTFPTGYSLSFEAPGGRVWLQAADVELELSAASAVWSRRLYPGVLPEHMPPEARHGAELQCRTFFNQTCELLSDAFWVNQPLAAQAAESKLRQLQLANRLGLRVPPTLVSNSPQDIRSFIAAQPRGAVTKLLAPSVQAMGAHPDFAYTTALRPEHLEALELTRWTPQIFQPRLRRFREFRVVVVGSELFVGALQVDNPELVDWRAGSDQDGLHWSVGELDELTAGRVRQMTQRLGLVYAAFDLMQEEEREEPFFLELNQAGEWGWLERDLGLPIAAALARVLVERT